MIELNGATLEGGGAILRIATALAVVTKKPCRIFNIRSNRPKPGLAIQHLLGIQALAQLCNGHLEGDHLGSEEIKFYPGEIQAKDLHVKIETAGSITLVLQTLIPPALEAPQPIKVIFNGGATDTFFAPTIDYFRFVFLKILQNLGVKVEIKILKRGYYPEGGAEVEVKIYPRRLKNLNLIERGNLKKITAISGASESLKNKKVAERQLAGVREILGKLGKRAEDIGKEAALELVKEQKSGACLDKHLADQILPYVALASGKSQVAVSEITTHCKTNIWVIEKFLKGKFKIEGNLITWTAKVIKK